MILRTKSYTRTHKGFVTTYRTLLKTRYNKMKYEILKVYLQNGSYYYEFIETIQCDPFTIPVASIHPDFETALEGIIRSKRRVA